MAFRYAPAFFEQVVADAGAPRGERLFRVARLPPLRETAPLVGRAAIGVAGRALAWEELALQTAAEAMRVAGGQPKSRTALPARGLACVSRSVRAIERDPGARVSLGQLAADAGLSPFHYLRTSTQVTGVTPHQFIVRARLREAAARLARSDARVIDVALESGFGDVSNYNRSFRSEFGVAPQKYQRLVGG